MCQISALDPIDKVVFQLPVIYDVKNADRVFAIRLNQIMTVAVLVGLVDVGDEAGLTQRIKHITAKRKHRVIHPQSRKDGQIQVNLLGHLL